MKFNNFLERVAKLMGYFIVSYDIIKYAVDKFKDIDFNDQSIHPEGNQNRSSINYDFGEDKNEQVNNDSDNNFSYLREEAENHFK